jgi:glycosyltransferase involved in cell wall biosynthesis
MDPAVSHAVLVSVVIPTWNRGPLLEQAVSSVLAQSEPRLELFVCDDGSTDDSADRIARFSDPRVRWLPGPRQGRPAAARNRGIAAATGQWVAFLDSDDTWRPDKLAIQLAHGQAMGAAAVATNALRIDRAGQATTFFPTMPRQLRLADLLRVNGVICSSCMVRRDVLQITGGFPEEAAYAAFEDYCLWLKVAAVTDIVCVAEPLVNYRDVSAESLRGDTPVANTVIRRRSRQSLISWSRSSGRRLPLGVRLWFGLWP